jgi:hypothetical protein
MTRTCPLESLSESRNGCNGRSDKSPEVEATAPMGLIVSAGTGFFGIITFPADDLFTFLLSENKLFISSAGTNS